MYVCVYTPRPPQLCGRIYTVCTEPGASADGTHGAEGCACRHTHTPTSGCLYRDSIGEGPGQADVSTAGRGWGWGGPNTLPARAPTDASAGQRRQHQTHTRVPNTRSPPTSPLSQDPSGGPWGADPPTPSPPPRPGAAGRAEAGAQLRVVVQHPPAPPCAPGRAGGGSPACNRAPRRQLRQREVRPGRSLPAAVPGGGEAGRRSGTGAPALGANHDSPLRSGKA